MNATKKHKTRFRKNLAQFAKLKANGSLNGSAASIEEKLQAAAGDIGLDFDKELKKVSRQNPVTFIETTEGKLNFGEITKSTAKKIKRQAGYIRLTKEGLKHIESHKKEIQAIGFSSVIEFAETVTGKFDAIYADRGALLLSIKTRPSNMAVIRLEPFRDEDFYVIKTALPVRSDYFKKKELLWGTAQSDHRKKATPGAISGHNSSKEKDTEKDDKRENPCGCDARINPQVDLVGIDSVPAGDMRDNPGVKPDEIYQMITDMVINTIEDKGHLPWQKAWDDSGLSGGKTATNFVSGNAYRGINFFMLNFRQVLNDEGELTIEMIDFDNPYFLTFNQIKNLGGNVKKDTHGQKVVYFTKLYKIEQSKPDIDFGTYDLDKMTEFVEKNYDDIKHTGGRSAEQIARSKFLPILKYYNLFHASDIEGIDWGTLPKNENADKPVEFKIEVAKEIYDNFPNAPQIKHVEPRAYYQPDMDFINMPPLERFEEEQFYHTTLFHEATHSTGHKSRLDRELSQNKKKYAFEELIAEMGAVFLCAESGILFRTIDNSASYLETWNSRLVSKMKNDNRFFFHAASRAQAAADYILDRDDKGIPAYRGKSEKENAASISNELIPNNALIGNKTTVDFKADGSIQEKGWYALAEIADVQASHNKDCTPNSKHTISRSQPRDRSSEALCAQPTFIAKNLNPASITQGNLAFVGTPVTTESLQDIQGNGRTIALKIAYDEIPKSAKKYKNYLMEHASGWGFKKGNVKHFKQPVLIRVLNVGDKKAIELGNVVDTSQAKMSKIDQAKAYIRNLNETQLAIIGKLIQNSSGETIGAIIDDVGMEIIGQMKKLDRTGIVEKNALTPEGKDFLRSVLVGLVFDGEAHPNALHHYLKLPYRIKAGLERSFGYIIPLISNKGDLTDTLSRAVEITAQTYQNEAINTAKEYAGSKDMFETKDFSKDEVALAQFLLDADTQKAIRNGFRYYDELLKGKENLFGKTPPKSKKEAFNLVFMDRARPNPERETEDLIHQTIVRAQRLENFGHDNSTELERLNEILGSDGWHWNDKRTQIIRDYDSIRENPTARFIYLGICERLLIDQGHEAPTILQGPHAMLTNKVMHKLFIVPFQLMSNIDNKVADMAADEVFERWHNYAPDNKNYKFNWPEWKPDYPVGTASEIYYVSDKILREWDHKGKLNMYHHEFDAGRRPCLKKGNMLIITNLEINENGILN